MTRIEKHKLVFEADFTKGSNNLERIFPKAVPGALAEMWIYVGFLPRQLSARYFDCSRKLA